jgi:hypothetical protein
MTERLQAHGSKVNLEQQLTIWNKQNQIVLPEGKGLILGRYPAYSVILFWG